MKGQNGHTYPGNEEWDSEFNLTEEMDHFILMHRDAHFGRDFGVMLEYYGDEEHIGIDPELDVERIAYLAEAEKAMGVDLAPLILTASEAERVGKARRAYEQLKEVYDFHDAASILPRLIADLVLSEEEEPGRAIDAVVSQEGRIVPELVALIESEDAYDPLFPGYGYAPYLAIICLGRIGDRRAIIPIFESLSREIVFDELVILEALALIGDEARDFLLKIIQSRPLTNDHVNAAYALSAFSDDLEVARVCAEQLKDPEVIEKPLLSNYLTCNLPT